MNVDMTLNGTGINITTSYDLKNPTFRYMTMPPPPPGSHHANPTESYFEPTEANQCQPVAMTNQLLSPTSMGEAVVSAVTSQPVMIKGYPKAMKGLGDGELLSSSVATHNHMVSL